MSYVLGVDLGTTFSTVAVAHGDRVEMADLGDRGFAVPSVVYVGPDGTVLVGDAARRRAATDPTFVVREVKRRLGDPAPVLVGERAFSPALLTAALLRGVVSKVSHTQGGPPAKVVLAHPADWGPFRREVFAEAAALSGLDVEFDFIVEPVAAAVWHAGHARVPVGAVLAVYDFGGGTFDAAVLRKTVEGFELLGTPVGLDALGGVDFDEALMRFVDGCLGGALARLDPTEDRDARLMRSVREGVVAAKEALSVDTAAAIDVALPGGLESVRITRREFEGLIAGHLSETVHALQAALDLAGVTAADVHKVLLVGGSSRIPLVAETIERHLGVPAAVDDHPKNVVALGAALAGRPASTPSPDLEAGPAAEAESEPVPELGSGPDGAAWPEPLAEGVVLVVASGPDGGALRPLGRHGELIVGREGDVGLTLHDPRVSRRHARLRVEDDTVVVEDLGSLNHSFVDGEPVSSAVVQPHQALRFGITVALPVLHEPSEDALQLRVAAGPATVVQGLPALDPLAEAEPPIGEVFELPEPAPAPGRRLRPRVDTEEYGGQLEATAEALHAVRRRVAAARRRRHPVAGQLAIAAENPATRRWAEHFGVTVGYAACDSAVSVVAPASLHRSRRDVADSFAGRYGVDHDVPVVVDLAAQPALAICGPPEAVDAVVRQLFAQVVLAHRPTSLGVVLLSDAGPGDPQLVTAGLAPSVVARLGHLRSTVDGSLLIGTAEELAGRLAAEPPSRRLLVVGRDASHARLELPAGPRARLVVGPGLTAAAWPAGVVVLEVDPVEATASLHHADAAGVRGPILAATVAAAHLPDLVRRALG